MVKLLHGALLSGGYIVVMSAQRPDSLFEVRDVELLVFLLYRCDISLIFQVFCPCTEVPVIPL